MPFSSYLNEFSSLNFNSVLNLLHLVNDYSWTKVHRNLFIELDKLGCNQQVFVPLRNCEQVGKNELKLSQNKFQVIYSDLFFPNKIFFRRKISFLFKSLIKKVDIDTIDLVHATTLFSDGAIAYRLFKVYQKPYIVTVRSSDLFSFLKYRVDLIFLCHNILSHAKRIIFVSESNRNYFVHHFLIRPKIKIYLEKCIVIYNGVDNFWISNLRKTSEKLAPFKLLYIGSFEPRKNLRNLLSCIIMLKEDIPHLEFSIVGGGGGQTSSVLKIVEGYKWIKYYGKVIDNSELLEIVRSHDAFVMVSFHETFGLVYIEALTQGLPITYTKGQGVDNIFDFPVGEPVSPYSKRDIKRGIYKMYKNYPNYRLDKIDFNAFSWPEIAKKYLQIYNDILK